MQTEVGVASNVKYNYIMHMIYGNLSASFALKGTQ